MYSRVPFIRLEVGMFRRSREGAIKAQNSARSGDSRPKQQTGLTHGGSLWGCLLAALSPKVEHFVQSYAPLT